MWKIIYNIESNYRDSNNRSDSRIIESEEAKGDTFNAAINNLIDTLKRDKWLNSIVASEALNVSSYDGFYSIEIVSFDEITDSVNVDIFNLFDCPEFKTLVDDLKKEYADEQKAKELSQNEKLKQCELKLLKDLQEKYPNELV